MNKDEFEYEVIEPSETEENEGSKKQWIPKDPYVTRSELAKQGTNAVFYLAGGALLMVMTFGARLKFLGIALSVAALVIGVGALLSKDREDKKPGIVILGSGLLGMVFQFGIPILKPFAGFLLGLGALGLFAAGIAKGIQFLRGLRSRS